VGVEVMICMADMESINQNLAGKRMEKILILRRYKDG